MVDSLEARISIMENIQEEFGYDIQEIKVQLARVTKLIEGHIGIVPEDIHGSPFNPLQSSSYPLVQHPYPTHEPHIPIVINVSPPELVAPGAYSGNHSSFWKNILIC